MALKANRIFTLSERRELRRCIVDRLHEECKVPKESFGFLKYWCDHAIQDLELRRIENDEINFEIWVKSIVPRFNADYFTYCSCGLLAG
ncbi:hypothetical protein IJH02_00125 [Candidatus Saccharibacteria bacterium]|nr:hypothetical protein [Candidatus Saccharibacteria bacterium]